LLGGAVFDIREVWAAAAFTRHLFPHYHYLEGIMRHASQGLLWAVGLGAAAAVWAVNALRPVHRFPAA
jgi:hypothetical protein